MKRIIGKKPLELKIDLGEKDGVSRGERKVKFNPYIFRLENPEEMIESAGGLPALLDYVQPTFAGKVKTKQRNFITAYVKKEENASKTDEEIMAALDTEMTSVSLKDFIRSAEGTAARAAKVDEVTALMKEFEGKGAIPMDRLAAILAGV